MTAAQPDERCAVCGHGGHLVPSWDGPDAYPIHIACLADPDAESVTLPADDVQWLRQRSRRAFDPHAAEPDRTRAALAVAGYVSNAALGWATDLSGWELAERLGCPPWCSPHHCIVDHPEQDGSRWMYHAVTLVDVEHIRVQVVQAVHHQAGCDTVERPYVAVSDRDGRFDSQLAPELAARIGRALVAAGELAASAITWSPAGGAR